MSQGNDPAAGAVTLSQFQQLIGVTLRMEPRLRGVWIVAELSDVRVAGGHCYMELVEKDERTGELRAKMRGMIWQSDYRRIEAAFRSAAGSGITSGLKVMVRGSVQHHEVHGLALNIIDIDPNYTVGDLERQRREILARLHLEGKLLLNRRFQSDFPPNPQRIAVISAPGAAGYGDFTDHLVNTPEGIVFYPLLFPAIMQGERTAGSVMSALEKVEMTVDFWDCVVIIRGGGATTDLNGFDNYALAERVATFPLPVVVGIGHERDRTVLDEIACVRCKTPTAVADFLVDRCRKAWTHTVDRVRKIAEYTTERLRGESMRLANIEALLPARVKQSLSLAEKRVDDLGYGVSRSVAARMMKEQGRTDIMATRLENALRGAMERPAMRLKALEDMVRALNPENTLRRGYSITRLNGKAVYTAEELHPGDEIVTVFGKGEKRSIIK